MRPFGTRRSSIGGSPKPNADQDYLGHPYTEQIEVSDQLEDEDTPSNFPRTVQTVRFVNPDALAGIGRVTSAPSESIREALRIDGEKGATLLRKRGGSIMDQVDDYLWEVYQRVPIKKDGTGDFTWKDPAAAKHMGLTMQDYVIGGMDPEFREQLYHAGRAMDAAGLQWSMLSAFAMIIAKGLLRATRRGSAIRYTAVTAGPAVTAMAAPSTSPADGRESEVWKWIDNHGTKYGLHRPLPKADPAHVQQRGDWQKIALALRDSRTGSAVGEKTKVAATDDKAKVRRTSDGKMKVHRTAMAAER